jgi:uncharacterized membrane protein YdbT with pleckstrin-like domain
MSEPADNVAAVVAEQAAPAPGPETEVWWGGYAARTMLPSFVGCILFTLLEIGAGFLLVHGAGARPLVVRWCVYYLTLTVWLIQIVRWTYCLAAFNYRLTSRRFYCWRGFLVKPTDPIELASVEDVHVHQSLTERVLGVGHIGIASSPTEPELVFRGVADPHHIAELIASRVDKARKGKT